MNEYINKVVKRGNTHILAEDKPFILTKVGDKYSLVFSMCDEMVSHRSEQLPNATCKLPAFWNTINISDR